MVLITTFSGNSQQLLALDTTETFDPGLLTDIEIYQGNSFDKNERVHDATILVGGGPSESLSLFSEIALAQTFPDQDNSRTQIGAWAFGLIWTVAEQKEIFALDILPVLAFEPNTLSDNGRTVYPDFNALSMGSDIEINILLLPVIKPYLLAGFHSQIGEKDNDWQIPLSFGFLLPLNANLEFLAQFDFIQNSESYLFSPEANTWPGSGKTLSIGLNFLATESLELISELGHSFPIFSSDGQKLSPQSYHAMLGIIITL